MKALAGLDSPGNFRMSVNGSQAISLTGNERDVTERELAKETASEIINRRLSTSNNLYADSEQRRSTVGKIMNLKAREGKVRRSERKSRIHRGYHNAAVYHQLTPPITLLVASVLTLHFDQRRFGLLLTSNLKNLSKSR